MEKLPIKKDSPDRQNLIAGLSLRMKRWFRSPGKEAGHYAENEKLILSTRGVFINCLI